MPRISLPRRRPQPERPLIPQRPDELTPTWFTGILGVNATVTDVEAVEIGMNVGFMGEVYRCHLTWDQVGGDLPASVIVKVPTHVDENFAAGDALQSYEREIVVYQKLGPTLGLPMPAYIYGAMDPDPTPWLEKPVMFLFEHLPLRGVNWLIGRFLKLAGNSKRRYILVLEDIVDARAPSQMTGGSFDDAKVALEVLARFHAANWMRTDAAVTYHRIWSVGRVPKVVQASYIRNRDHFIEHFGQVVGDDVLARLDDIQTRVPEIRAALAAEPWTLLHGDYRLDNLLFRPNGEIVVLDLQGLSSGRPSIDVAYFITTALTAEHCVEEEALLRAYHDALVEAGVTGYSFTQLRADCAQTKEMLAHGIASSADVIDTSIDGKEGALMDMMQLRVLAWLG